MKVKKFSVGKDEFKEVLISGPGEYLVELVGSGAEVSIRGAFSAAGSDRTEVSVVVHHQAPHTRANTMLRGVGRDSSRIKFEGRIIIDHDCGNTNSFLTERVLLLSDQASAECIPDLEIHTDDVRCSHAASITNIPGEQIFYLMSRGVSKKTAEEMIVEGFLALDD